MSPILPSYTELVLAWFRGWPECCFLAISTTSSDRAYSSESGSFPRYCISTMIIQAVPRGRSTRQISAARLSQTDSGAHSGLIKCREESRVQRGLAIQLCKQYLDISSTMSFCWYTRSYWRRSSYPVGEDEDEDDEDKMWRERSQLKFGSNSTQVVHRQGRCQFVTVRWPLFHCISISTHSYSYFSGSQ